MESNMQQGLFLDLDGTLADSLGIMREIYYRFLQKYDRQGSDAEFDRLNGPSLSDVLATLRRDHQLLPEHAELLDDYKSLLWDCYMEVQPAAGAKELVEAAVSRKWNVGVVTSNVNSLVRAWLKSVGLADRITTIATGDMVSRGKPAPDLYAKALRDAHCDAAKSLAVEDTPTGARSALGAGLSTIVILHDEQSFLEWPASISTVKRLEEVIPMLDSKGRAATADV